MGFFSTTSNIRMRALITLLLCYLNFNQSLCQQFNARAAIEFFCPCEEFKDCPAVLGQGNFGPIFQGIAQTIPRCEEFDEVRCCTRDMMFTAVTIIMNANAARTQIQQHPGLQPQFTGGASLQHLQGAFQQQQQQPTVPLQRSQFTNGASLQHPQVTVQQQPTVPLQQPQFTGGASLQHPQGAVQQQQQPAVTLQQPQPPTFQQQSRDLNFGSNIGSTSRGSFFGNSVGNSGEANTLPAGLSCVPHVSCPPGNRYVSDPSYIARFGRVAPSVCSITAGDTLCVDHVVDRSESAFPDRDTNFFQQSGHSNPADEDGSILNLLGQLSAGRAVSSLPAGVQCVPMAQCLLANIYGTHPSHFRQYGVINPSAAQCLASSGNILCVSSTQTNQQGVQTPAPVTQSPVTQSPVLVTQSPVTQAPVTQSPVTQSPVPVQPSVNLPCLPPQLCDDVFGTQGDHFTRYGRQAPCLISSMVRCVDPKGPSSPTSPPTTPPTSPPRPNPLGPVGPSVSIIGPQPIYVSYNHLKGPSVGADNDVQSVGSVSSQGVQPGQQQQIETLLNSLKNRLRNIIG